MLQSRIVPGQALTVLLLPSVHLTLNLFLGQVSQGDYLVYCETAVEIILPFRDNPTLCLPTHIITASHVKKTSREH